MTVVFAALMIVGLAAAIAYPLWAESHESTDVDRGGEREQLRHEKDVALLASREAELDRAMGKLSDEDYGTLRQQYEHRAVAALGALDQLVERDGGPGGAALASGDGGVAGKVKAEAAKRARFCSSCGRRHRPEERFCPACGHARH
jgi:hypothetical protein